MKTHIYIFFFLLLITINSMGFSQDFWEEVFTSGPTIFSMDISEDGVIYLGTANGIWKSFDNGDNWAFDTISTGNLTVYSLETGSEGIVYAGCNTKIYYSEDYGNEWSFICNGCVISNFTSLLATDQNIIYGGVMNGIIRSEDNGNSWQQVLLSNDWATTYCITESNDGTLYAGLTSHYTSQYSGIYRSVDNGFTWEIIEVTSDYGVQSIDFNAEGNLITAVIWDQNWIFGGIYEYDPTVDAWQCLKYGERGRSIVVNKIDDYYAGIDNELSNGGCRVSYDNGETWESINYGLSNSNIREIRITPYGFLFSVSSYPAKVFRSIEPTFTRIFNLNQPNKNVSFYPNPFSQLSDIFLESNIAGNFTLEIYNSSGKKLYCKTIFLKENKINKIDIESNDLQEGIHLFLLRNEATILSTNKLLYLKH